MNRDSAEQILVGQRERERVEINGAVGTGNEKAASVKTSDHSKKGHYRKHLK
jgi:hypothetical protein